MKFSDIIDQASTLLQRKGRITYRALKREFALDDEALADLMARYGVDPGVFSLTYTALVLWHLGYLDQARQKSEAALTLAQEQSSPYSLASARFFAATFHQLRRERLLTQEWAEAGIPLAREHGFPQWLGRGAILQGWARAEQGQSEEGMSQMRHGLATYQAVGAGICHSYYLVLLAEAYGKAEQAEEGLATLAEALTVVDTSGERFCEAELYRLKGELTLQQLKIQNAKWLCCINQ